MLAIAALSILITAPLGAWAIPTFAPRLLERGEVDPTRVAVSRRVTLLAAVDTSPTAVQVLTKAAELARRSDAEVTVLHVVKAKEAQAVEQLQAQTHALLADIHYRFITVEGATAEVIVRTAQEYKVDEIVIGKRGHQPLDQILVGSVSQAVLESSPVPVVVVESPAARPKSSL